MTDEIEETNAGVKKKGDWEEVAEFGEELEKAMQDSDLKDSSVQDFQEWRPKTAEAENDMRRKTVEQASINEKKVEEESNGVRDDMRDASEKAAEAGKKAANRENPEPEIKEASKDAAKPFFAKTVEYLRDLEQEIYSKIMLKFNPFYLDTRDFTVDFRSKEDGDYEMDVNVSEDGSREKIKESLRDTDE